MKPTFPAGRRSWQGLWFVAAVGLALITTVNQLQAGIVSLYQSITGDLASIGTPAA